jgi:hypothetical protein
MKLIEIYNGTAWVKLNCDTSKLTDKTEKQDGQLYGRLTFDGTISVYRDSYDLLDTIASTEGNLLLIRIYFKGEIFNCTVDAEQNNNIDFRYKDLKVKVTDEYSEFDKLGDTEYNYLEATNNLEAIFIYDADPPASYVQFETLTEIVETVHSSITLNYSGGVYLFDMGHGALTAPTYDIPTIDPTFSLISAYYNIIDYTVNSETVGVTMNANVTISVTYKICRENGIGVYAVGVPVPPAGVGWVFLKDIYNSQGNKAYPLYVRPIPAVAWANANQATKFYENGNLAIQLSECVGTGSGTVNSMLPVGHSYSKSRARFVKDILEYIVNDIDNSILFDNTGTSTDSFYFMNSYISELWKYDVSGTLYPNTEYNNPYKWLTLMPLPNAITDEQGTQKTNGQTISNITFNKLVNMLSVMGFRWYLELRGSQYYFILTHKLIVSNSITSLSLASHQGNNFQDLNFAQNIQEPEYNIIHNSEVCSNYDFVGKDINFEKLNVDNTSEYTIEGFYKDINDIRYSGNYNDSTTTEHALLAVQPYLTTASGSPAYIVRFPQGELTNAPINNAELAWSYISANLISELPSQNANVNGADVVLDNSRVKKRGN